MVTMEELQVLIGKGNVNEMNEKVKMALDENIPVKEILESGLIQGMSIIGEKFKRNEIYVPEMLIAARAMKSAMSILAPLLKENKVEPKGKVVIGTVKGDLHDIGKNLVALMMEGAGFQVTDIGIDATGEKFMEAINNEKSQLLMMSALLTTTMSSMKDVIDMMKESGSNTNVKIMVGGAPVTQSFADEIGAHGFAQDAASAVEVAKTVLNIS